MPELATKTDLLAVRTDLLAMQQELHSEIRTSIAQLRSDLHNSFEILTLRLTIRLGVMMLLAMWAAVIIIKCV